MSECKLCYKITLRQYSIYFPKSPTNREVQKKQKNKNVNEKKTRKYTAVNYLNSGWEFQPEDFQSAHEVSSHCLQSRDTQVH